MAGRAPVLFVAWSRTGGRATEIAEALGGEALVLHSRLLAGRRLFPLRYLVNAVRTVAALATRRPAAVVVTNPPVVPAVIVAVWSRLTGRPFVLDSHPSSFGAKDHVTSQRLLWLHRRLARRARAVLVTTREWVDTVRSWGGRGVVVHEAPLLFSTTPLQGPARGRVLFPGVFARDEPLDVLLDVARARPDLTFRVTGDPARSAPGQLDDVPPNVHLTGFLGPHDFAAELDGADVVVALTTEPTSVQRCGYEAVYARRPLVVSDFPAARDAFPCSFWCDNDAASVAAALDAALAPSAREATATDLALKHQSDRWAQQLEELRWAISTTF